MHRDKIGRTRQGKSAMARRHADGYAARLESQSSSSSIGPNCRSGWVARVILRRPTACVSMDAGFGASRDRSNKTAPVLPPDQVKSSISQVAAIASPIEARWARR